MIAPPMPVSSTNRCTATAPAIVHPASGSDARGLWREQEQAAGDLQSARQIAEPIAKPDLRE